MKLSVSADGCSGTSTPSTSHHLAFLFTCPVEYFKCLDSNDYKEQKSDYKPLLHGIKKSVTSSISMFHFLQSSAPREFSRLFFPDLTFSIVHLVFSSCTQTILTPCRWIRTKGFSRFKMYFRQVRFKHFWPYVFIYQRWLIADDHSCLQNLPL